MKKENKKYFLTGLLGVVSYFIMDGVLLYLGFDASAFAVSLLESLFG